MNKKLIIALLALSLLSPVFAREFHIKSADITINVLSNGLVNVVENRTYAFSGCYSVIYREIPLLAESFITEFEGFSNEPFYETRPTKAGAYVYEFNFNAEQCNKDVNAVMVYNMSRAVDTYDDASSLQYVFWGRGEPYVDSLKFTINLPEPIIDYWLHNTLSSNTISSSNNSVQFSAVNNAEGQWFEIQVLFNRLSDNTFSHMHEGVIVEEQRRTEAGYLMQGVFQTIFSIIFILLPFIAFYFVYAKYGREEKVDYNKVYEQEPPSKDSPALVSAKLNTPYSAEPSLDAFIAVIFDLAERKYLSIMGDKEKVVIKLLEKGAEDLEKYEAAVLDFLKSYSSNNILVWKEFEKKLQSYSDSEKFQKMLQSWKGLVRAKISKEEYFNNKGNNVFLLFSIASILIFGLISVLFVQGALVAFFISLLILIVLNIVSRTILGRWTEKGRLFELSWRAFKKFLNDYSLISKHPPQSIVIWEKYLVYALVLGAADNVIKAMKVYVPNFEKAGNVSVFYYHPYFYHSMRSALFASSVMSAPSSGGRGFGGGTGGFGGGHGGGGSGAR